MNDFIQFVLYELSDILFLLLLAAILAAAVITVAYCIFKKKHNEKKPFPWRKIILSIMFAGYLFIVISATMLRRSSGFQGEYNLHLFRAWLEAWNDFSVKSWANLLLNIALFIPLGVLLPLLWKKCRSWYITLPIGLSTSLCIELIQLAVSRGICDIDDLFANALGVVIGFFSTMAILSLRNEKGHRQKPCLIHGGIALLPVLAICSIFIAYSLQEYGNLPNAPAYRNNTGDVSWILECPLPAAEHTVSVYRTQAKSTSECDSFAGEIAKSVELEIDLVSYYQDFAYYNLRPGGILLVYYYDGSYEFRSDAHWNDTTWGEADRHTIENALSVYPADIPTQAQFTFEGNGWHSFTVHLQTDGVHMYDGTLRARYAENGKVEEVENHLCSYSYYDSVEIISPAEALDRLKAGKFHDAGYFERVRPTTVTVTECTLAYQIDTKGFYQPVYIFCTGSPDGTYADTIMIPAMK